MPPLDTHPRLPAAPIARAYVARGAALWLAGRVALVLLFLFPGFDVEAAWRSVADGARGSPGAVPLAVLLGLVYARWGGQRTLLANLGVSRRVLSLLIALGAAAGELTLALALVLARRA